MTLKTPPKTEIVELLEELMLHVDMDEGMDITIATDGACDIVTGSVDWAYQTGDNSYTGACYGYQNWAVGTLEYDTDIEELALDLIDQIDEALAYVALHEDTK